MTKIRRHITGAFSMLLCIFLLGGVLVYADPRITENRQTPGGGLTLIVNGLPEGAQVNGASAQIGTEAADVTGHGAVSERMPVQTLLMLDNSRSMHSFQRGKELLQQIVDQHAPGERFRFVTFSNAIVKTTDAADQYTEDYVAIKSAIDGVQSQNLDTFVNNALIQAVHEMEADPTESYKRIIIVSDGGDKSTSGNITQEEMIKALVDYPVPVYCIGSQWDSTAAQGLSEFSALGRQFGAYMDLDQAQDLGEIVRTEQADYSAWAFDVAVPEDLQDGNSRNVKLSIDTSNGPADVTGSVIMPFLERPKQAAEPTAEPVVTEEAEPTPEAEATPTEAPKEEEEEKEIPWLWIGIGGGVLLLLLILLIVLLALRRKKKKKVVADDEIFGYSDDEPGGTELFGEDIMTVRGDDRDFSDAGDEETQMMFTRMDEMEIILTDVRNGGRRYSAIIKDGITIGKSSKSSDLVITGDTTISRTHCRITSDGGRVYLEDMGSTNGTWVNRERVQSSVELVSGDTLRIGNTELSIEIR